MPKRLTPEEREQRRQQLSEKARRYYWEHRERFLGDRRRKYHQNQDGVRDRKLEYERAYRRTHMPQILAYQKLWKTRRRERKELQNPEPDFKSLKRVQAV